MKNYLFTIIAILSINICSSQVEIIDKIAGTLIPTIVTGIKEIKGEKKKAEKNEVADKLQATVKTEVEKIIALMEADQKNLNSLNEVFKKTGKITDNLGALKALSRSEFLDAIAETMNHKTFTETAMNFDDFLVEVETTNTELGKVDISALDPNLRSSIQTNIVNMTAKINLLSRRIKRGKTITTSMTYDDAKAYVENINRSETRDDISDLDRMASDINLQLSSWVTSTSAALEKNKVALLGALK